MSSIQCIYYACYKHTWEIIDKITSGEILLSKNTKIMYNMVHVYVIQWSM